MPSSSSLQVLKILKCCNDLLSDGRGELEPSTSGAFEEVAGGTSGAFEEVVGGTSGAFEEVAGGTSGAFEEVAVGCGKGLGSLDPDVQKN